MMTSSDKGLTQERRVEKRDRQQAGGDKSGAGVWGGGTERGREEKRGVQQRGAGKTEEWRKKGKRG